MNVVAGGRIILYESRGQYQLDCMTLVPLGQGALAMAFEAMKARLLAEGLFDPEHKQPLPQFPRTIGLVTSRDGAALRDILTTLRRRMPLVRVILYPTLVQGAAAAADETGDPRALRYGSRSWCRSIGAAAKPPGIVTERRRSCLDPAGSRPPPRATVRSRGFVQGSTDRRRGDLVVSPGTRRVSLWPDRAGA